MSDSKKEPILLNGDCLEEMSDITDDSIDMVLVDPPYGTTACNWDVIIDLKLMWEQLTRIIKSNKAIVIISSQPFTTKLIDSNMLNFCYCWVWNKRKPGNIFLAKIQPMKIHEDICVFSKSGKMPNFYPIKTIRSKIKKSKNYGNCEAFNGTRKPKKTMKNHIYTHKNPVTIIDISNANQQDRVHPTQKPIALMEYLIRTYTDEHDTVLDFTMGSGTTGIACKNLNRKFIGIEKDKKYFEISKQRIEDSWL